MAFRLYIVDIFGDSVVVDGDRVEALDAKVVVSVHQKLIKSDGAKNVTPRLLNADVALNDMRPYKVSVQISLDI